MPAARLRVDGSSIRLPDGSPAMLRGFNLGFMLDSVNDEPHAADNLMQNRLPQTSLVRLVMLHWHDRPTLVSGHHNNDCSVVSSGTISQRCLTQIDRVLQWTAHQGLWAILTARGSLAAGEEVTGHHGNLYTNSSLRRQFIAMWRTVVKRFKDYDRIAGFEPLSEPRVQGMDHAVRTLYVEACTAIYSIDPLTPCIVGPSRFYNPHRLESAVLPLRNVICARSSPTFFQLSCTPLANLGTPLAHYWHTEGEPRVSTAACLSFPQITSISSSLISGSWAKCASQLPTERPPLVVMCTIIRIAQHAAHLRMELEIAANVQCLSMLSSSRQSSRLH